MAVKDALFSVGYDKNHELDFGVRADTAEMTDAQFLELQSMILWGLAQMHQGRTHWKMSQPENQAQQGAKS